MHIIYSKDNCPSCVQAKQYFSLHGIEYREIKIVPEVTDSSNQIGRESFVQLYPGIRVVPYIVDPDNNLYYKTLDEFKLQTVTK